MAIKKIFKSRLSHVVYVTKKGKNLSFIEGKYVTDDEDEIRELEQEIKSNHPHIFVDPDETHIDTTLQEKIQAAQKEATLRVIAEHEGSLVAPKNQTSEEVKGAVTAGNGVENTLPKALEQKTMSAASLLNVANTASLAGLRKGAAAQSNATGSK